MNTNMLEHPAVQRNMQTLTARGVSFVDPGEGFLACGWIGKGRLAEPEVIVEAAERRIRPSGTLLGRRFVVSAGPTYEDLDPVRYIGNRSSGRMGYAIAEEAARRGAHVVLVSGPTSLQPPTGVQIERVRSAAEMHRAMLAQTPQADAVIMAAAVADYTPRAGAAPGKIEKRNGPLTVALERTPDILAELGRQRSGAGRPVLVGFAAETGDPKPRAREKLAAKQIDLIVANDVSRSDAGFDVETNAATLLTATDEVEAPLQLKSSLASLIIDRVEQLLAAGVATPSS